MNVYNETFCTALSVRYSQTDIKETCQTSKFKIIQSS